ncbi:Flp family type IVb pilin [Phreatobacter sp.]|uniref:Flp family type IVb pilin n=1 Tax=Phreatobacter sp. TaxID=1966341 RepID=UPI003F701C89
MISRFAGETNGATAIEYSMVAAGIAGVVVAAVYALGSAIDTNFYGALVSAWR